MEEYENYISVALLLLLAILQPHRWKKFDVKPLSHRGGRWYIDTWYIGAIKKLGYIVDCSVTPGVSWKAHIGHTCYGKDYTKYPHKVYHMGEKSLLKEEPDGILEVPPTIMDYSLRKKITDVVKNPLAYKEILAQRIWLRPNGNNLKEMMHVVEHYEKSDCDYLEFMIHSSELMPGGSPTFTTTESVEKMYAHLKELFERIGMSYKGIALKDYARRK